MSDFPKFIEVCKELQLDINDEDYAKIYDYLKDAHTERLSHLEQQLEFAQEYIPSEYKYLDGDIKDPEDFGSTKRIGDCHDYDSI